MCDYRTIQAFSRKRGVSFWIANHGPGRDRMFMAFQRDRDTPPGTGRDMLALVCALADQRKETLTLFTYNRTLEAYYEDFGFLTYVPEWDHDKELIHMIRLPQPTHRRMQ